MHLPTTGRAAPGIHPRQLLLHVIRPTLAALAEADPGIDGPAAEALLLATAAAESGLRALDQWTGPGDDVLGPAIGLWQIEPATHRDVCESYLAFRRPLADAVFRFLAPDPAPEAQLATNLAYACAIARLVYRRSPVRLARPGDVEGHARVWKAVYNTHLGKGSEGHFVRSWHALVAPAIGGGR